MPCRPLFVQFCANSPQTLLEAARLVQDHCDAVDINLGCPQRIAKKGKYGAFLMEQPDLIESMVTTLAQASMPHVSLAWFSELHVLLEVPLLPCTPGRGHQAACFAAMTSYTV